MSTTAPPNPDRPRGLLDWIEWAGNKLPDPVTLFAIGALAVMALSHIAHVSDWRVHERLPQQVASQDAPAAPHRASAQVDVEWVETGRVFEASSLLTRDGLDWAIRSMVDNFIAFPPLGVVLVGMLGIGIAERTGLIAACLKSFMRLVPGGLLTPAMLFIGIMSSMTLDAGYVVLPPLAAALYKAVGRSPMAGLAAVFAGVSAGFNANLFITGLDPMLARFSNLGARVVEEGYAVNPACNWSFMIASTFVITLTGWAVTAWFVERRLRGKPAEEGGPSPIDAADLEAQRIDPAEARGLKVAGAAFALTLGVILAFILIPGAPLHTFHMPDPQDPDRPIPAELYEPGAAADEAPPAHVYDDGRRLLVPSERDFPRWVDAIVPLLFFSFIIPAVAFGVSVGSVRSDKDVARLMIESMAAMAPIIVLAFVAAQFIAYFRYSGLDRMLAMAGGQMLGQTELSPAMLIVAFIGVTMVFNLFIGSMSAKYALFAPIFIPMFMMVGISPELTQNAYRIGDSVTNIITPLNPYLVIILVFMRSFVPRGGIGTLISTMFPYTVAFSIVWVVMLLIWMGLGIPLGPDGGLTYAPPVE